MAFIRKARIARRRARQGRAGDLAQEPYYQGDAARHAHQPDTANPHPAGSPEHIEWLAGWTEAHVNDSN